MGRNVLAMAVMSIVYFLFTLFVQYRKMFFKPRYSKQVYFCVGVVLEIYSGLKIRVTIEGYKLQISYMQCSYLAERFET